MWIQVSQSLYQWSNEDDKDIEEAILYTCFHTDIYVCHWLEYYPYQEEWVTSYSIVHTDELPERMNSFTDKPTIDGDKEYVDFLYKIKPQAVKEDDYYKGLKDNYPYEQNPVQFGATIDFKLDDYYMVDQIMSGWAATHT